MASRDRGIGMLSKRSAVNTETIRYYEKIGLLPPPPRTSGGHRVYPESHVKRLNFIRRGRELGFTLDEIRNLLKMVDGGPTCGEVRDAALTHLTNVRRKIADLKRMERTLSETIAHCKGGDTPDCPIVEALFHGAPDDRLI